MTLPPEFKFDVTTGVPEQTATTTTNEALATKTGDATSETKTVEEKVDPKADETASESTEDPTEDTLEETESEESETEDKLETKPEDQKPKKKSGFQRTKEKLNREIEYWRTEAIKNQKPTQIAKEETVVAKVAESGKPDKAKYETHDEYIEAVAEWKADQKFKSYQEDAKKTSAQEAAQKKLSEHFARVESFKEAHEDFDEAWETLSDKKIFITLAMQETIKKSNAGPALMYALAKDHKECARIAKLEPLEAAEALGELKYKISKSSTESSESVKPKTIVKDPVVNPVRTRGASNKKNAAEANDLDEYIQIRGAEERARSAARR